jgi:hypothetical protein
MATRHFNLSYLSRFGQTFLTSFLRRTLAQTTQVTQVNPVAPAHGTGIRLQPTPQVPRPPLSPCLDRAVRPSAHLRTHLLTLFARVRYR